MPCLLCPSAGNDSWEKAVVDSKASLTFAKDAFLFQLLSMEQAGSRCASTSAPIWSWYLRITSIQETSCEKWDPYLWPPRMLADLRYASHTTQSLMEACASWLESFGVRARFSMLSQRSKSSCHWPASAINLNLNLQRPHSPLATTDSGPKWSSCRFCSRCSGLPTASVILSKSSSSCGDWMDLIGSCLMS